MMGEIESLTELSQRMRTDWEARGQKRGIKAIVPVRNYKDFWETGCESVNKLLHVLRLSNCLQHFRRVLDIGCGLGRMEYWLASKVTYLHGIDVSPVMVGKARTLNLLHEWDDSKSDSPVMFSLFDGVSIPLDLAYGGRFNLVFSWITIQHLPDVKVLEGWLESLPSVLEEDGVVVLQYKTAKRRRFHGQNTRSGIRLRPRDWPTLLGRFGFRVIYDWCFPDDSQFRVVVMEQVKRDEKMWCSICGAILEEDVLHHRCPQYVLDALDKIDRMTVQAVQREGLLDEGG